MKRKVLVFTLLIASAFIALPVESFGSADRSKTGTAVYEYSGQDWRWRRQRRNRNRNRGWRDTNGYRNYGQYRRTQVGNRRFGNRRYRLVRRTFWDDGRRYTRWIRVY